MKKLVESSIIPSLITLISVVIELSILVLLAMFLAKLGIAWFTDHTTSWADIAKVTIPAMVAPGGGLIVLSNWMIQRRADREAERADRETERANTAEKELRELREQINKKSHKKIRRSLR